MVNAFHFLVVVVVVVVADRCLFCFIDSIIFGNEHCDVRLPIHL